MSNRLALETSPYLRQHSDNPVDWFPWGEEAFDLARSLDRPIFLSVGYSSCHWCHVMEHESFVDGEIAEILNRSFVSIKVDREERPDLDEAYLTFVQMLTGRGGWPMSVFLMPDRSPFFGGTYFPKQDRGDHRGFRSILVSLEKLWQEKREELAEAAQYYAAGIKEAILEQSSPSQEFQVQLSSLLESLKGSFDSDRGGFSRAPKFPPHSALHLLLALDPSDAMATKTLIEIGRGGIHDHVGGGFHRYSTDGEWRLPHFEKMLYDNALLLKSFSQVKPDGFFSSCARGITAWLKSEMVSPEGLFYSALDADSEGEEGRFYVWKYREILELADGETFAKAYQCQPAGNFHDEATGLLTGENVLHLAPHSLPLPEQLSMLKQRRSKRVRPQLDDKCLIGWNGLAISGLISAGELEAAIRCASSVLESRSETGDLPRYVSGGKPVGSGFLEDYAYFALGLFDLAEVRSEFSTIAGEVGESMVDRFYDSEYGGFFGTSDSDEELFGRTKPVFDQPIPSPNSAAIRVLIRLGRYEMAEKSLKGFAGWMRRAPMACEGLYLAAFELESEIGPIEAPLAQFQGSVISSSELSIRAKLPPGWRLNPLISGNLLDAFIGEKSCPVYEVSASTLEVEFSVKTSTALPLRSIEIEFQLCTEDRCLLPQREELLLSNEPLEHS